MAYSSIVKPSDYFNTKLYTGNGVDATAYTGVGFQPDWTWIKNRSASNWHILTDAVRGATKQIYSNSTTDEDTVAAGLQSFNSDGFTLGTDTDVNGSGSNYASWNWKANGAGSSNTDGSITSTVSANTTSGFSIVSYTGTNATGTVGHGLGVTPKIVLYKNRTDSTYWYFTTSLIDGSHDLLLLPATDAQQPFSASLPTSSVLNLIANNDTNGSGDGIIAYCFAEKTGYSKFGTYTGNGNADGTFIYTGFKPAFILMKRTNNAAHWIMYDNKRSTSSKNLTDKYFYASLSDSENTDTSEGMDFLSNGFKHRNAFNAANGSGDTFIYMAFAAEPLVSNSGTDGVPATAR